VRWGIMRKRVYQTAPSLSPSPPRPGCSPQNPAGARVNAVVTMLADNSERGD